MKKLVLLLLMLLPMVGMHAQGWTSPSNNDFTASTVVYATLQTNLDKPLTNFTVGAFVNDECRAVAEVSESGKSAGILYMLRVWGDPSEESQKIIFKTYDKTTGLIYELKETETFAPEKTVGEPSKPITLTLMVAESCKINLTETEVGATYNLMDYVVVTPEGATLPTNVEWEVQLPEALGNQAVSDYVTISGSTLTTKKAGKGLILNLYAGNDKARTLLATTTFDIIQHITAINLLATEFTVNKGDAETLNDFLNNKAYTVEPEGTDDVVLWEVEDASVIQYLESRGAYVPVKGGTTRMRPYVVKSDGSKLYPANNAWITITVVVPVTQIVFGNEYVSTFEANVDDKNIYDRLSSLITVLPEDASNKGWTLSAADGTPITIKGETTVLADAAGSGTLVVTSKSNPEVTASIPVVVHNPAKVATFTQTTMFVIVKEGETLDITDKVIDNISLDGVQNDWNGSISVQNTDIVSGSGTITNDGIVGQFTAKKPGSATVTVTLTWNNYDAYDGKSATIPQATKTYSFTITVTQEQGLQGFAVTCPSTVVGTPGTITLTPQPAGASFDPNSIRVTFGTNPALPESWASVITSSVTSADLEKIVYTYQAEIPCFVTVSVTNAMGQPIPLYSTGGNAQGNFSGMEVGYSLNLNPGWAWRTNTYGDIASEDLEKHYGVNLIEIRTQDDLLYNDPEWGYFGTLLDTDGIAQNQCYKINMKQATSTQLFGGKLNVISEEDYQKAIIEGNDGVKIPAGWSWLGCPYLYDRLIVNALPQNENYTDVVIIGKNGSVEYGADGWEGDLTVLEAGQGFLINNPYDTELIMSFVNEFLRMQPADEVEIQGVKNQVWDYDGTKYMNNMTIVGALEGVAYPEDYIVGAFVGNECRGEGIVKNGHAFITVHCNLGEIVSLKLYNTLTGEITAIEETVKARTRVGSLKAPLSLHVDATAINGVNAAGNQMEAYDLSGRRITTAQPGVSVQRMSNGSFRKVVVK